MIGCLFVLGMIVAGHAVLLHGTPVGRPLGRLAVYVFAAGLLSTVIVAMVRAIGGAVGPSKSSPLAVFLTLAILSLGSFAVLETRRRFARGKQADTQSFKISGKVIRTAESAERNRGRGVDDDSERSSS